MTVGTHARRDVPARRSRGRRVAEPVARPHRAGAATVRRIGAASLLTAVSMGAVVVGQTTLGISPSLAAAQARTVVRYAAAHPVASPVATAIATTVFRSGVRGSNATGPAKMVTQTFSVPGCPQPPAPDAFPNGKIPAEYLCVLPEDPAQKLRSDAAAAWVHLDSAYVEAFGTHICMTDSYRSLKVQKQLFKRKPLLAAFPGTSNHGLGVAVDLCGGIEDVDSVQHAWLSEHGAAFGWANPPWAQPGGSSKFEPWHWEYADPSKSATDTTDTDPSD